jgi:hypothetical protein
MPEVAELWEQIAPKVREGVTGIGIWTALKVCVPIALEDSVFVLGVPPGSSELGGHLRMPMTARLIETNASQAVGSQVRVRVIDGTTLEDWEVNKRRDAERRRMQEAEMAKMKAQLESKTSWEGIYEKLSREFAAVQNRSLPQNRGRFFDAAISIVAEARKEQTIFDDNNERNFARCIERISQYTEISSSYVAYEVLKRAEEL